MWMRAAAGVFLIAGAAAMLPQSPAASQASSVFQSSFASQPLSASQSGSGATVTEEPSEQIETGRAHLPNGAEVSYRIRLLPPASFPALPSPVAGVLNSHRCLIPQTYEAHQPENVIRGSFEKQGSDDWALLCSVDGATTLYVFFQSRLGEPIVLRRQRDSQWLGAETVGAYGSAWGIAVRHPSQFPRIKAAHGIDHDGIDDSYVEKSTSIHYFQNGNWISIDANN